MSWLHPPTSGFSRFDSTKASSVKSSVSIKRKSTEVRSCGLRNGTTRLGGCGGSVAKRHFQRATDACYCPNGGYRQRPGNLFGPCHADCRAVASNEKAIAGITLRTLKNQATPIG